MCCTAVTYIQQGATHMLSVLLWGLVLQSSMHQEKGRQSIAQNIICLQHSLLLPDNTFLVLSQALSHRAHLSMTGFP